jgi:hypothetical protein
MISAMSSTIFLVIYGQLVTKWRDTALSDSLGHASRKWERLFVYFSDPLILSTYTAALGGSIIWIFVVERYDVAIAFPAHVGLIVLSGALVLGELRALGIFLIVLGVAIVSCA